MRRVSHPSWYCPCFRYITSAPATVRDVVYLSMSSPIWTYPCCSLFQFIRCSVISASSDWAIFASLVLRAGVFSMSPYVSCVDFDMLFLDPPVSCFCFCCFSGPIIFSCPPLIFLVVLVSHLHLHTISVCCRMAFLAFSHFFPVF